MPVPAPTSRPSRLPAWLPARAVDALAVLALARLAAPWVAPGTQPADAGELQLVARHLGVAHPPGYPLYTLTAHAFGLAAARPAAARLLGARCADVAVDGATCAPWALWPWAVSLLGALLAAATLVVVYRAGRRLGGGALAGLAGAAALAASPTFLAQATVAGIRMPTALLAALVLGLALRWLDTARRADDGHPNRGGLAALALAFALGAGHHPSLVVLAPLLAALVVARRPRVARDPRALAAVAAAAALGLAPLTYLPLRSGAMLAPDDLATWRGFWHHASAAGFRGDVLYFDDPRTLLDRLAVLGDLLALQLGPLGLALAAAGAAALATRRRPEAALLVGSAALVAALSITYRAPQTVEYLMPAYVALALLAAAGVGALRAVVAGLGRGDRGSSGAPSPSRARLAALGPSLVAALCVAAPLWRGRDVPAAVAGAAPALAPELDRTIACLGSEGRVLAGWHHATPLWVAALARGPRAAAPPPSIDYVAPDFATGDPIGETWRRLVAEDPGHRPLIATNRPAELAAGPPLAPLRGTPFYVVQPSSGRGGNDPAIAARCTAPPSDAATPNASFRPAGASRDPAGAALRLEAAHIGPPDRGGAREVTLWFAPGPTGVDAPATAVVQLVDPATGTVHGQWDRPIPNAWSTPDGPAVRAALVPFAGAPAGPLEVRAGVYRTGIDGPERLVADGPDRPIDAVTLGVVGGARGSAEPHGDAGAIPFGADMTLAAWRVALREGQAVVDLTWRAGLAGRSDFTVSVHVAGDGWTRQHDGTPALGALPTLKWLPGWRVRDRHRIDLAGASGPAAVSVGVYDAFSLEPLPVTDAERVRRGEGQRAVIWRGDASGR